MAELFEIGFDSFTEEHEGILAYIQKNLFDETEIRNTTCGDFKFNFFVFDFAADKESAYYLDKKEDNRGWLAELVKSEQFGQMFVSKTHPGITRGNHWHHTKTEKFIVIQGQAAIRFRKLDEDKVIEYIVDGEKPQVLDIPPGYTHSIENIGQDEVITLFWSNEMFNPEKPDTYFLEVNK